ncbi:MAG: hypothetical protein LBI82_07285 [Dysgonamonadaceae bacterium]|jgi:hypothetical protein|nr:hypothetical protein [Dysgonamonadaceae bacterium]
METIIVEIAKYTYIDKFFLWLGVGKEWSGIFALIITFIIISLLIHFGKSFYSRCKTRKTSSDLAPYYNEYDVKRATKYFIPTNGQNISPTKEDEPGTANKFITRQKLIPFFINNVFRGKKESDKFYLILADSGMGKTTLLINLYMKYNSISNFFKSKYDMKMLPFGDDRIIQTIKDIAKNQNKAKKTILLLDAFDEYKGLLPTKDSDGLTDDERFRKLLDEIFEITRDFRNVVITSRTQYFPAQEESPYELNIRRFGKDGFHKLSKLYLSPFDEKDIKKYLNKKFGVFKFWNLKKKLKAKKITGGDSLKLMVRPMLLSYINLLVDEDKNYTSTFDIYETLIKKWIEREGDKRKHNKDIREKFKSDLLKFSKLVAIEIYKSGEYSKGIDKNIAQGICKKHNINLEGYEITGQSLLTRDVATNWKFAHKSIYEFFIAEYALEDVCFGFSLDITSLDMTKKFINEKNCNSSLYLFNHIPIDDRDNYYISNNVVNFGEVKLVLGNKTILEHCLNTTVFSKIDAINYCNELNKKFGYGIFYDRTGRLCDENFEKTNSTKVKGFIFPTMNMLESLQEKGYIIFNKDRVDSMMKAPFKKEYMQKKYRDMYQEIIRSGVKYGQQEWCLEMLGEKLDSDNWINEEYSYFNVRQFLDFDKFIVSRKFLRLVFVNNMTE